MTKLLGMSGSLRKESFNTKLVREAARLFDPADFRMANLRLPLFDADVEAQGYPEPVQELVAQARWADALVIGSPEYNYGPTAALKNAIDWLSRFKEEPPLGDKPVAIVSATAGMAGGQRSKTVVYTTIIPLKARVIYLPEVGVGQAGNKFDDNGQLTDEGAIGFLQKLMDTVKAAI